MRQLSELLCLLPTDHCSKGSRYQWLPSRMPCSTQFLTGLSFIMCPWARQTSASMEIHHRFSLAAVPIIQWGGRYIYIHTPSASGQCILSINSCVWDGWRKTSRCYQIVYILPLHVNGLCCFPLDIKASKKLFSLLCSLMHRGILCII